MPTRPDAPGAPLSGRPHTTSARLVVAGLIALLAFTATFVTAFNDPTPHRLRVAVVGSPDVVRQARTTVDPGQFDIKSYDSVAAARRALATDEVRGVLVAAPGRYQAIIASAYGFVPAQMTKMALTQVAARAGAKLQPVDARPLPKHDSRGLSSFFTATGTVIASLAFGILLTLFGGGLSLRVRLAACFVLAAAGGVMVAFSVDTLVGALTGEFWGVAGIAALLIAAISLSVHGLGRLIGPAGLGLGSLVFLLVGVSSAGGGFSFLLQPGFYRAVSQVLPDGAAVTALRNEVYFSGAHTAGALVVLVAWVAVGIAMLVVAAGRGAPLLAARPGAAPATASPVAA